MKFMKRRAGFTLIELLTVTAIIGLLATIAVPHYTTIKKRGIAASIIGDVRAIQIAAFSYYTEHNEFPPPAGSGQVPPELVQHLPANFSFVKNDLVYRWQHWDQATVEGGVTVTRSLVGVRVATSDSQLLAILSKVGGPGFVPIVTAGDVVFMIAAAS
jgi:prepilin-type N-terminal cleavage/methylation domain-containing protein